MLSELFEVTCKGDPGTDTEKAWDEEFRVTKCCSVCRQRLPQFAGERIDVVLAYQPDNYPIQYLFSPCELINIEFFEAIERYNDGYLAVGDALLPDGTILSDFCTITTKRPLGTRGTRESTQSSCLACRAFLYYPMPFGYEYILEQELFDDRKLYMTDIPSLLLTEDVLDGLPSDISSTLVTQRIPIKKEPEDGIEDFPPVYM